MMFGFVVFEKVGLSKQPHVIGVIPADSKENAMEKFLDDDRLGLKPDEKVEFRQLEDQAGGLSIVWTIED